MKKQFLLFISIIVLSLFVVPQIVNAQSRTSAIWAVTGEGGVDVIPYVRVDKKGLFVDFENFNDQINYVYYNLNYNRVDSGIKGGVEGSFFPSVTPLTGHYDGVGYIRREMVFGTCSQGNCIYHQPKDVTLTVVTSMKPESKVAEYTEVLNFTDSQFQF